MTFTFRTIFFASLTIILAWFIYLERAILTPFILAAIFAYILNPLIDFLSDKTKIGRVIFIVLFYILLFSLLGWAGTFLTKEIFGQVKELANRAQFLLVNADSQIATLPVFLQDPVKDSIASLEEALKIEPTTIWPLFSGAATRVFSVITFLFASFYFLKDGKHFIEKFILLFRGENKIEVEILLRRVNGVLGNYLRGQLLIVIIMATLGTILFSLLGAKFFLILGLTIGLAEIIPMIGPIIAGAIVVIVSTFDGVSRFGAVPLYDGLIMLAAYTILNQIENYFIVPQIMGKITNLHPLVIFFSVLAGGHLFGILGFILAVPTVATLRILLEYSLDKLASK